MGNSGIEKRCWWYELNMKFFNMRTMNDQRRDFNNLKQGNLTVTEAVIKFNQLHGFSLTLYQLKKNMLWEWCRCSNSKRLWPSVVGPNPCHGPDSTKQQKEERFKEKNNRDNKKPQEGGPNSYFGPRNQNNSHPNHNDKKRGKLSWNQS